MEAFPVNIFIFNYNKLMNLQLKKTAMTFLFSSAVLSAFATPINIKGLVRGADDSPLPGASIMLKDGNKTGTITDMNGHFTLSVEPGTELIVKYMGYQQTSIKVGSKDFYTITLEEDNNVLDDVVVVGYSTNKKVNLSGSVSSIDSEQISGRPITNVSTALQGMAPGVTVTTQSGSPGGDGGNIRIRGIGTLGGDNADPLVLIDGVEGTIDEIDPNVIESVSILKDAASASIYGSRAANGVILVTTKRGTEKDKFSISYQGFVGFQRPTRLPDTVNAIQYMELENVAAENDGSDLAYSPEYIEEYRNGIGVDPDKYPDTDWQDAILTGSGLTHGHTATLTASSDRIKILTSVGYKDQQGLVEHSNYRRVTVRNNMDIRLTERLQLKFDFQVMNGNRLQPRAESTVFNYMNTRPANMVNQFTTGLYNGSGMQGDNPVLLLKEGGNKKSNTIRATGSFGLKWNVLEGLELSGTYTPRYITKNVHTYKNSVTTYGDPEGTTSFQSDGINSLTESSNRYFYNNLQFLATYSKKFGRHDLKVLFGAERETYDEKTLSAYREGFNYPEYDVINAGNIDNMDNGGGEYEWALQSFFGRINYNFMDRYLLEANFRADGSSRFASGNKYSYFPSVSAAWRISEEAFMEPVRDVVNNLKLRASWGMLGNQNIGSSYYPTVETLSTSTISMGGNLYPIATQTALANPDLVWETSTMTDIGLDLTLFNSLNITADWYYKTTDDILMKLDIPNIVGFSAPYQNAGKVRNVGWELGISYQKSWGDFSLGVLANLSDVKNEIIDMKGISSTSGEIRNQEGSPINSIYGLVCEGFVNSKEEADWINENCPQFGGTVYQGDLKYKDINHDDKITTDDKTIIGSTIPRYTYSLGLNMEYKRFHLNVLFQGVGKADGYLNTYYVMPCQQGGTYRKEHLDYWREDNKDASTPRLSYKSSNNSQQSSFWMRDASYLRLKSLQLGYDLPKTWLKPIGINSAYVYVDAQNLFTWTDFYQGYDPEVNYDASATDGVSLGDANNYPQVSTFTMGIKLNF